MSFSGARTSGRAPGPSSSVTKPPAPRTTATGRPDTFPLTSSAAAATSSATAATVISSVRPNVSVVPRRSSSTRTPAAPTVMSVSPSRHARPAVSVTSTPRRTPNRACSPARSARADASGPTGRSSTVPSGSAAPPTSVA